jgi:YesN/AraC family two-component response regulator
MKNREGKLKTIFIVDDEPVIRSSLKNLIQARPEYFTVCGEAINGLDALDKIAVLKPDIVITDIRMPEMDGLELIRQLKDTGLRISMIVLSAYDDFYLVKQSFLLGVKDYILKSELTENYIHTILSRVLKNTEKNQIPQDMNGHFNKLVRSGMIKDILQKRLPLTNTVTRNLRELGSKIFSDKLFIITFQFSFSESRIIDRLPDLESLLDTLLLSMEGEGIVFDDAKLTLIMPGKPAASWNDQFKYFQDLHGKCLRACGMADLPSPSTGLSSVCRWNPEGYFEPDLHQTWEESVSALKYSFIDGINKIFYYPTALLRTRKININTKKNINLLLSALQSKNDEKIHAVFDEIKISANQLDLRNIDQAKELYGSYRILCENAVNQMEEGHRNVPVRWLNRFREGIQNNLPLNELNTLLKESLKAISDYYGSGNPLIKRAVIFLRHTYRENVDLQQVADAVGISRIHLSRLFTKTMGVSLMRYREELRVKKGEELLENSDMKIYEIADYLGYSSPEHFTRNFKRITGVPPKYFYKERSRLS